MDQNTNTPPNPNPNPNPNQPGATTNVNMAGNVNSQSSGKQRGEHKMITILLIVIFFGMVGFHRLYLGHLKSGFAQLGGVILGFVLVFGGVGAAAASEEDGLALLSILGLLLIFLVALSAFVDFILILIDKMKDSKGYYIQR